MCGIMGYVGSRPAVPIVLGGLKRLEYRGYDSAGIAALNEGSIDVRKAAGKIANLLEAVGTQPFASRTTIGHTRWATHGRPTQENAHPHTDFGTDFAVVHNGIIENFEELKDELIAGGVSFRSETDSEVLAHLVAKHYDGSLENAVRATVAQVEGAYAMVVISVHEPDKIIAARMVSPLVLGFGVDEMFLASGIPALLEHTNQVMALEDGEMAIITGKGVRIETLAGESVERLPTQVELTLDQAEKGGYEHFMLKEIHEQEEVVKETLRGRLLKDNVLLEDVHYDEEFAKGIRKIWITACGTAYHAGLVGKQLFEGWLRIPTEIVYAHEFRYGDPLVGPNDLVIAISQSGETVDTLIAALRGKELGGRMLAITNVAGSALSMKADDVIHTRAGIEISVASTKAYMAMLVCQVVLALDLGVKRGTVSSDEARGLIERLKALPEAIRTAIDMEPVIEELAEALVDSQDLYFIGRGLDYAAAMESSLKLKEVSYLHSEAMPAGELKHGSLALISEGTPVLTINTQSRTYDKTNSAVQEVKARGAMTVGVGFDDQTELARLVDHFVGVPRVDERLAPAVVAVPLQLLAYHVARKLGHEIDQPRNLAKSVTVE